MIELKCDRCGENCGLNASVIDIHVVHNPNHVRFGDIGEIRLTDDNTHIRYMLCQSCYDKQGLPNPYRTGEKLTEEIKKSGERHGKWLVSGECDDDGGCKNKGVEAQNRMVGTVGLAITEYITREKVADTIRQLISEIDDANEGEYSERFLSGYQAGLELAELRINDIPSAYVRPHDARHWGVCCSKCETVYSFDESPINHYCPNCGTKMDGRVLHNENNA